MNTFSDNIRGAGMRQVHIWVPDTRKKSFAIECAQQSRAIRGDAGDTDTQDWMRRLGILKGGHDSRRFGYNSPAR